MLERCLWCGDPHDPTDDPFCNLCRASGANPNNDRYQPHTVHTGQFFEVDFDLFCGRMGIKDATLDFEPTEEQLKATAAAVDRAILGRLKKELDSDE